MSMRHLSTLTIKVSIGEGDSIEDTCKDLCELSNRIGCTVEADFNGVTLLALVYGNPLTLVESYKTEIRSDHSVKMACNR